MGDAAGDEPAKPGPAKLGKATPAAEATTAAKTTSTLLSLFQLPVNWSETTMELAFSSQEKAVFGSN